MQKAKNGDKVKVDYKVHLESGDVVDTSIDRKPLKFTIGQGSANKIIEKAVIGMSVGETKTIEIPPEHAYGQYREDLVFKVEKSKIPSNVTLKIGMSFHNSSAEGKNINLTVTDISEDTVILNGNHPYAGETLKCVIKLQEIE